MTEETKATTTEQPKKGMNGCLIAFLSIAGSIGAILFLFVGCVGMFAVNYNDTVNESEGKNTIKDTSWVPEGFTAFNNKVAYKYAESGSYTCSRRTRCLQMEVVSKEGCDSLYVEMAEINSSGANVGYNNETTSGLAAGQKAILVLDSYNDAADTFRLSKISCY